MFQIMNCVLTRVYEQIVKFLEIFNAFSCPKRAIFSKNQTFHETGLFSLLIFLYLTNSMTCHILLERTAKTEKNGI